MSMTELQKARYSRNMLVKDIGDIGQEKLLAAKVLVIGAGGLGSPNLLYLAAVGIGTIGIADSDVVDISNHQRQVIHYTSDIGRPKVESAKEKIERMNPDVKVNTYHLKITPENTSDVIKDYDFIVECTDNFSAKFLINDACVLEKKPYSHCGVLMFHGQTLTYVPGHTCLRCLFNSPPPPGASPTSSEVGIFGTVPGAFGAVQATEAVKCITGAGELLTDRLLHFDMLSFEFSTIKIKPDVKCPVCGKNPKITQIV